MRSAYSQQIFAIFPSLMCANKPLSILHLCLVCTDFSSLGLIPVAKTCRCRAMPMAETRSGWVSCITARVPCSFVLSEKDEGLCILNSALAQIYEFTLRSAGVVQGVHQFDYP
ncbi:hypothetical protein I3843_06G163100 [Carya illinoinensis]|nr:hypothetical protein I3843_06G163100 [Carya illinoinensis]